MSEIDDILSELANSLESDSFDKHRFESALQVIHDRGLHHDIMNSLLRDMLTGIDGVDIFTSGSFFELASEGGVGLVLIRYSGPTKYIYSSPVASSQKFLSRGSFRVDNYRLLEEGPLEDVFDATREIELVETQSLGQGDIVSKHHADIIDFTAFESTPSITLRLTTPPSGNYEWAFDRKTLRALRYSTLLLSESNLCGIFELLSEVGDDQTADYLARFTSHQYHFVRWKAVQSLAALNPARALDAVQQLADDHHPDVRHAARSTLAAGVLQGE